MSEPKIDPRFNDFIFLQAQNAGFFLGQIPNPATGETRLNLPAAESVVDALEMLTEKTKGNLTPDEEKLLLTAQENIRKLFDKALKADQDSPE